MFYCYTPRAATPTPVYSELGRFSKYAVEAEEATARGLAKSDENYPRVFVSIVLGTGAEVKQMKTWLQGKGIPDLYVPRGEGLSTALKNKKLGIYFSELGEVQVMVTGDLLRQIAQQPGYGYLEDGCQSAIAHYFNEVTLHCPNEH